MVYLRTIDKSRFVVYGLRTLSGCSLVSVRSRIAVHPEWRGLEAAKREDESRPGPVADGRDFADEPLGHPVEELPNQHATLAFVREKDGTHQLLYSIPPHRQTNKLLHNTPPYPPTFLRVKAVYMPSRTIPTPCDIK